MDRAECLLGEGVYDLGTIAMYIRKHQAIIFLFHDYTFRKVTRGTILNAMKLYNAKACYMRLFSVLTAFQIGSTVYLLIYRTAKNNYFGNCPGIIGTDFYRACEVSGIIRTSKQLHASQLSLIEQSTTEYSCTSYLKLANQSYLTAVL